jgi:hypothetical protein
MTAEAMPLRSAIQQRDENDLRVFDWSIEDPPLHARYRFEWSFRRGRLEEPEPPPSERMRRLGIVQPGDRILEHPCEPFNLPREAEIARGLGNLMTAFLGPLRNAHSFGNEGCLSLFDVRGIGARPLCIEVQHTTLDGRTHLMSFERAAGRLWAHEIDHVR